jgi:hypothetical protein
MYNPSVQRIPAAAQLNWLFFDRWVGQQLEGISLMTPRQLTDTSLLDSHMQYSSLLGLHPSRYTLNKKGINSAIANSIVGRLKSLADLQRPSPINPNDGR